MNRNIKVVIRGRLEFHIKILFLLIDNLCANSNNYSESMADYVENEEESEHVTQRILELQLHCSNIGIYN